MGRMDLSGTRIAGDSCVQAILNSLKITLVNWGLCKN